MNRKANQRNKAFTLVELMVVIVIIGILAAVVTPQVLSRIDKANRTAALAQIKIFMGAIDNFKIDTKVYPDNSTGLQDLVEQPADLEGWDPAGYLNSTAVPLDPWGYEYIYEYTGDSKPPYEIYSLGADGEDGGEGNDADVSSRNLTGGEAEEY